MSIFIGSSRTVVAVYIGNKPVTKLFVGIKESTLIPPVPTAPVNISASSISGQAKVGQVLTANNGTWSQNPTSYQYQWFRNGTAIAGATAKTYTLVSGDLGTTITVSVRAVNAIGTSSPSLSPGTAAVAAAGSSGGGTADSTAGTVDGTGGTVDGGTGTLPASKNLLTESGLILRTEDGRNITKE